MSRSAKFNLLTLVAFAITILLLACVAHAQGAPDPNGIATSPGSTVDGIATALSLGAYGAATLGFIELAELGLLWFANRPGSRLKSWVTYLSAAAGITATALATLVARGQSAELRAVPVALMVALAAYYSSPSKRDENTKFPKADTLPIRKDEAGIVNREIMMPIVGVGLVMIGIAILLSVLGCGPLTKQIVADAKTCARAEVAMIASDLTQDVENILVHGAKTIDPETGQPAWKVELNALKVPFGSALLCAVQAAMVDLEAKLTARLGFTLGPPSDQADGLMRAKEYVRESQ